MRDDVHPLPRRRWGAPPPGGIRAGDPAPYGWAPLVILFLVGLVDRIEAGLLSGLLPLIQAEWGIGDTVAGAIPTGSAIAAAAVAIPAGYLADRFSRTRVITVMVFLWALATTGSGLAPGFAVFFLTRMALAAAEHVDNPATGSLLADYYPPISRAKAFGWTRMSAHLGGIGTVLGAVLGQAFGWRAAFLLMAIPGLLTAAICLRLREPARGLLDRVTAGAATAPTGGAPLGGAEPPRATPPRLGRQVRDVLAVRTLVIVTVGLATLGMGVAGLFYWMPTLIGRTFALPAGQAGALGGMVTVIGVITGTLAGAWLGRRAHVTRKGGRVLVGGCGVVAGAIVMAVALLAAPRALVPFALLTAVAVILMSTATPNLTASLADVIGASSRGIAFALAQLVAGGATAVGPLIVGILSDRTGSLTTALLVMTLPVLVGGLLTVTARGPYERDAARVLDSARGTPTARSPEQRGGEDA
ncbi:Hexuronate transporter [Nonomuraea coxensis DSM 45129]|uniref:Hexuronate transporter n=1 Tax=Nonomuraea coxensis DSM 45129 TaxID=1122611 RepID=A0ABX8TZA0_9ACTN|nr:MFS transporter [Nonomuraea coxensis]QYC40224.1 Hexuronate transporter [Nonomuraea coxensis DSM 45129]